MHVHAIVPRLAAEPTHDSLESIIAAVGRPARHPQAELMPALVRYWLALVHHDVPTRRDWLAATQAGVRSGAVSTRAFVVFALGETDESIVFDAVLDYVGTGPVSVERRQAAAEQATDWIRRGLALNRSAVFAALLSFGDASIDATLAGLRLILTHAEIASVCRAAAARPASSTRVFLADWLELLDAAAQPDARARRSVAEALAAIGG